MPDATARRTNWLAVLGWACYLACSWTWCIGMYLPVLLIRDYGIWGFVVFAVPNVVGAAAMGFLLRGPRASADLVGSHRIALFCFTLVTVMFQFFFFSWFLSLVGLASWCVVLLLWGRSCAPGIRALVIVMLISVAALVVWALEPAGSANFTPGEASTKLAYLAPICLFGFGLCPYMDVTFHRAVQSLSRRAASWAFVLGFGVIFLAMIVLTVLYAPYLGGPVEDQHRRMFSLAGVVLSLHLFGQMAYTLAAHSEATAYFFKPPAIRTARRVMWAVLPLVAASTALGWFGKQMPDYGGFAFNEVVYRLFMAFYGLVFPAYVWLCMIPTWRAPRAPTRREIGVWLGTSAVAAPAYWMGFIERREWWLVPGLAVVLLARLLVPRGDRGLGGRSGAPVPVPSRPLQGVGHAEADPS
jgi:hypothetical protein